MIPADTGASPCAIAVRALSAEVARALRGAGDPYALADVPHLGSDPAAALAAVRVLGPDALAPHALRGTAPRPDDVALVRESLLAYPATAPRRPGDPPVAAWRDWATARLLRWFGAAGPGTDDAYLRPEALPSGAGLERGWPAWSVVLAQLAPLALPGLDSPLHEEVRHHRVELARAVTRSVLRRDYRVAARLARWLALVGEDPAAPVGVGPLVNHLEVLGDDPRLLVDASVARLLLEDER
ncbi:hypothetical protein [Allostreptomyces psammosilenae]|uniref:Uncharacterized protein n=1 Tax=Allostreptomyces psammosilenae TaxID=1892865 RepID=A0A852ZQT1_9ACTN|nr:hypothetical protein [Allostreptomyces psammosilenae]NYI04806.1 hypothetical protein [Allostreptomyces psammosilenae]